MESVMQIQPVAIIDSEDGNRYVAQSMTEADLDQVAALEKRLFHPPWSRNAFTAELTDRPYSLAMVIKDDEIVIAYMVVYLLFNEAHLANIAVAPEYQRHGLGEWMIRYLEQAAEQSGQQIIFLEVRKSNEKAIRLYQKMGFSKAGVRKRYYEDQEDALLMSKMLVQQPQRK